MRQSNGPNGPAEARMKRRRLIVALAGGCAGGLASLARAQPATRPKVVAVLGVGRPPLSGPVIDGFRDALRDLGWVEGRNVVYEFRWAEGRPERLPGLARELVALSPDVIWTFFSVAAVAARQATTTIPIVVASSADPVGIGLAESLARPNGNVTGLSSLSGEIAPKLLEMLRAVVPRLARVAVLSDPGEVANAILMQGLPAAAHALSIDLVIVEARNEEDFEPAFARMSREKVDGLLIPSGAIFNTHDPEIRKLAARYRLPTAGTGGFVSYGQNAAEMFRRSASVVDRILRGAKPGEIPIERASRLDLIINLKEARSLGLTIPPRLLLRADQVIE